MIIPSSTTAQGDRSHHSTQAQGTLVTTSSAYTSRTASTSITTATVMLTPSPSNRGTWKIFGDWKIDWGDWRMTAHTKVDLLAFSSPVVPEHHGGWRGMYYVKIVSICLLRSFLVPSISS